MCRFLVYKGKEPILLSKLILEPAHSILTQSYDSRLRLDTRRPHNGDGFGLGYYVPPTLSPDPMIFTSTTPAWNSPNLSRLASKTQSPLVFAHVRATTAGNLSEQNCHPFGYGPLMFMHNGGIGGWDSPGAGAAGKSVKRRLVESVGDRWFALVQGNTDSEWAFAVFLDSLVGLLGGEDPGVVRPAGIGHSTLRRALLRTIARINAVVAECCCDGDDSDAGEGGAAVSLLNFAVTDGRSVVCSRYVSSKDFEAASLFFSSGTAWQPPDPSGPDRGEAEAGRYRMERRDKGSDIVLVASEPLTFERDSWVTVPTNSTITVHGQTVLIHPIVDEHYVAAPAGGLRSPRLVRDKGLAVPGPVDEGMAPLEGLGRVASASAA